MQFRGNYLFLSNFYPCTIKVHGFIFKDGESAFQSFKCVNVNDVIELTKRQGASAKSFGRYVNMRSDWNSYRLFAMQEVLTAKFTQNPELLEKLKTVQEPIVEENTWNDKFWGVCNGVGENYLGKILEELKNTL